MKPIKRTYRYSIRATNGELRLTVRWNCNRVVLPTRHRVKPEMFSEGRCVRSSFHNKIPAAVINRDLEAMENKLDEIFYKAEYEERELTPELLKAQMSGDKGQPDFWKTLDAFVIEGEKQHQWAFNTVKSVRQVLKLLKKFDSDLTFSTLTAGKLEKFVIYQQTHKLHERKWKNELQQGSSNTTIIKNCRVVRWMLRWAAGKGYISSDVERLFSPSLKTIDRPVIFLKWPELMRMLELDLSEDRLLDEARDFFCFCCFTSLRFSDASALKTFQVKEDCIEVLTQKTGRLLRIELNKYSRAILAKHQGKHGEHALPQVSVSKLNYRIAKVGKLAEITEPVTMARYYGGNRVVKTEPKYKFLTSHCGRRTFICNALAMGIAPNVVMKWTGHSEYSAMKPYIDIADEIKSSAMSKFDER